MLSSLTFLSFYLFSGVYGSIGPTANVFIQNKIIGPDGFNRSTVLAGGVKNKPTFPGPLIKGNKGDTFRLNVVNELNDTTMLTSTSIHWHGIFQKGTAWADGPVGVTQCPIAPGHSFNYEFTGLTQTGTYWYHSHYSVQYCDGLRGAMVIYDPDDPYKSQYDFDDDSTVITLADWYHTVSTVLAEPGMPPPQSVATLINGLGRFSANVTSPLAVISVIPNKRYRFRLVSISCDPNFTFSIDKHTLIIIEVDGNNVQPLSVDSIQIFAGQRYSFILQANQQTSNYWVRALPNIGPSGFGGGVNSAILRYVGAPAIDPTTPLVNSTRPLNETNLQPLTDPAAPGPAVPPEESNGEVIPMAFNISLNSAGNFTVNNFSFSPPPVPVLLQVLSGARTAQELMPIGSVYTLPPNKVIEITIPGGSIGAPHPIHLHGHAFSVIRSAGATAINYNNPVRRDVVNSGASTTDDVKIRFQTDNAGPWIMHCHIDWHLNKGLAIVLAEDVPGIAQLHPPAAWDQLCPIFDALPPQTFP